MTDSETPQVDPLAELSPIERSEAIHGLRFGDPDNEHAAAMDAAVHAGLASCVNPLCPNRGHHIQYFADTPLPIHCGRCHAILVDDPTKSDLTIVPGVDGSALDDIIAEAKRQTLEAIRNGEHLLP